MSNTTASQPSPGRLSAFKVSRVWRGNTVYVFAAGELDVATAPRLEDACEAADGVTRLVVDLRAVTFIDSAGGRVLVGLFGLGRDRDDHGRRRDEAGRRRCRPERSAPSRVRAGLSAHSVPSYPRGGVRAGRRPGSQPIRSALNHDLRDRRAVHRRQGPLVRRGLPRRLHPPDLRGARLRRRQPCSTSTPPSASTATPASRRARLTRSSPRTSSPTSGSTTPRSTPTTTRTSSRRNHAWQSRTARARRHPAPRVDVHSAMVATQRCVEVDLRDVDLAQVGTSMGRVIGWNGLGWSYGRTVGTTRSDFRYVVDPDFDSDEDFDAALLALRGILGESPAAEVPGEPPLQVPPAGTSGFRAPTSDGISRLPPRSGVLGLIRRSGSRKRPARRRGLIMRASCAPVGTSEVRIAADCSGRHCPAASDTI